jgi:hypothetical protein
MIKKKAPQYKKMTAGGPFVEDVETANVGGGGTGDAAGGESDSDSGDDGPSGNAIAGSTLAALGLGQSLMEPTTMEDKAGSTILSRTGQGASAGAVGGALGIAIGAGAGLLIGGTEAVIESDKKKKATRKANFELDQSLRNSVRDSKFAAGDSFSLDENPLNSINGIDEIMNRKKRKGVASGMAVQYLAKGGKVVGPGGPKDDKVKAKLSKGSFIVPSENAKVAEVLRKAVLGEDTKKSTATKSGVNVMLSNGEHHFTPQEVKKMTAAGINLDLLAPEADEQLNPGVMLSKGLKSDTDKKSIEVQKKAVIALMVKKGVSASKAEKYVNSNKDSHLLNQSKEKLDAAVTELKKPSKGDLLFEKAMNSNSIFEKQEAFKKLEQMNSVQPIDDFNKKYYALRDNIAKSKKISASPKANSFDKTDKDFDIYSKAFSVEYNKAKMAFDAVSRNPENFSSAQIKAVKNNYDRHVKDQKLLESGSKNSASKTEFLKYPSLRNIPIPKTTLDKVEKEIATKAKPVTAPKTASISAVSLTDPAVAVPEVAPTIPKKTGTGAAKAKKPVITMDSLKPVLPSEEDQLKAAEIDLAGLKKIDAENEAKAAAATPATVTTPATAGNPSPYQDKKVTKSKFIDAMGGAAGIASLGQLAIGIMGNINEERPVDSVSPELMTRYFDAVHDESKADLDAKEGFSASEWSKINSQIETNRIQTMNDIVASGGGGNASQLRALSTDKNKALIDANIASEGVQLQKRQFAIGVSARADQLGSSINESRRRIFTDSLTEFQQNQEASADLINAGLGNFINNLAMRSLEKEKPKTTINIGTNPTKTDNV